MSIINFPARRATRRAFAYRNCGRCGGHFLPVSTWHQLCRTCFGWGVASRALAIMQRALRERAR
jgi:hypothetical protein